MPFPDPQAGADAVKQYAADRAIDDPAKLARAARIVRTALARQRLTLADITGDPAQHTDRAPTGGDTP